MYHVVDALCSTVHAEIGQPLVVWELVIGLPGPLALSATQSTVERGLIPSYEWQVNRRSKLK